MPRRARIAPGGLVYHALNRAVARLAPFEKQADYLAFERIAARRRLLPAPAAASSWKCIASGCRLSGRSASLRI